MKLHCHRTSLAAALQVAAGVVPSRTTKDVLKSLKLTAEDGHATLLGTDLEVSIRYEVPGIEIVTPGEALLAPGRLISILREISDETVTLELSATSMTLRGAHSEFEFGVEDPNEFPQVPEFNADDFWVVSGGVLREGIRRTLFATDVESTRYALGGVQVEFSETGLTLAATDSRRLAVLKTSCRASGSPAVITPSPVVPSKAMSLIERSIAEADADVQIALSANNIQVKTGNSTIISQLVEGRFPNYRGVLPESWEVEIPLLVGTFYSAVRQAQIVTNNETRGVDFTFSPGMLTLKSHALDVGNSRVEMPIEYDGSELTVTFDNKFIADFLKVLPSERQVLLRLTDAERATVFQTDDALCSSYSYVVMPLARTAPASKASSGAAG